MSSSIVYKGDNLEIMKGFSDVQFDIAIVDPPYGIGEDWKKRNKGQSYKNTSYKNKGIPTQQYFNELKRVSKNQIIWGYNYFTEHLGPTNYLIFWDKQSNNNDVFKYSKGEIAYTTFKVPCNLVSIPWDGYRMGEETGQAKIHPHQKPIKLYRWIYSNYANVGDKILDTHLGSGSNRIAAFEFGCDFVGIEKDETHFNNQEQRFTNYKNKLKVHSF